MNGRIRIELLSDLCVSDGSAYNSMIDNDVCHDRYGFPYIPAKRIRGCLRECAMELKDWGENIDVGAIFGKEGAFDNGAKIHIGNAYINGYENDVKIAEENSGHALLHPENILNSYTYIRTQTSIDYKTGVAEDNTLRTTRVIDKGLVFYSEVEIEDEYFDTLAKICKVLRHMGVSRTRGLGEVKVCLEKGITDDSERKAGKPELINSSNDQVKELEYRLHLVEPAIFKSVNGEESRTKDYIDGSTILGIILQQLKKAGKNYSDLMDDGKLVCSNAYIQIDGKRSFEAPGYLYGIKNEKNKYVNKLYEIKEDSRTEDMQLEKFKHCYVTIDQDGIRKANVETEERYHHRRPEDKSIGRAVSKDNNADFYSMESVCAGQTFIGKILGAPEQINMVYEILKQINTCRIGYSRNSEYGKAELSVTKLSDSSAEQSKTKCRACLVRLVSPTIIYSKKAIASSDPHDLIEEILYAIDYNGIKEKTINDVVDLNNSRFYLKYSRAGGFNTTWNRRKPVISVFDKGTAMLIRFKETDEMNIGTFYIGERNLEGYGECEILSFNEGNDGKLLGSVIEENLKKKNETLNIGTDEFLNKLCDNLLPAYIRAEAAQKAEKKALKADARATVSNMSLMAEESDSFDLVEKAVHARYNKLSSTKREKMEFAEGILKDVKKEFENNTFINGFCKNLNVSGYTPKSDELELMYLKAYLMHIKYYIRGKEGVKNGK